MRGKAIHRCAFRALDADQGAWSGDERYRHGKTWCGRGRLFTEEEREAGQVRLTDCPKCAAAIGAYKLANAYAGRVRLMPVDRAASTDYRVRHARAAYEFHLDEALRGYVTSEAGFGKGWRLFMLHGALSYWHDPDSVMGSSLSGERPDRYHAERNPQLPFAPVHFAARDAMACAAVKAAERGEMPTQAEQVDRKAEADKRKAAVREEREEAQRKAAQNRARLAEEAEERRTVAALALDAWQARGDLSNVEAAGLAAVRALLGV